jgi:hypothetical protein
MEEHMELEYRLLTPGEHWPDDAASLAAAIRSQGPFQPVVEMAGPELRVRDAITGLTSHARLAPYPAQTYEALIQPPGYAPRMTERDRDTALAFQRTVEIRTSAVPDSDPTTVALFHATVTDGLWWLLGGFLADPYRRTVWGWRRWRGDQPLAAHAAETAAHLAAPVAEGGPA